MVKPHFAWVKPRLGGRFGYLLVFLAAFLLRGVYLVEMRGGDLFQVLLGDAKAYHAWGSRLAAGDWRGQDVFYQAPMYPYFLGVLYTVTGPDPMAARIIQILLGSLSCLLLAVAGTRFFGPRVGLAAGLVLAVYPCAIFMDGLLQKSGLDVFFLCALLVVLGGLARDRHGWRRWVLAGVLLGCLSLTRENALVLVAVVVGWGVWGVRTTSWPRRVLGPLCLLAALAVMLLPVALRNLAVGGEFHLTTAQMGPNLYIGNHEGADGTYTPLRAGRGDPRFEREDARELAEQALGRRLTPGEVSHYWSGRALSYMRAEPGAWLRLMGRKALLLVNRAEIADTDALEVYADRSRLLRLLVPVLHFGVLAPLAGLGLVLAGRERRPWILYLLLAGYALSVVIFFIFARYRHPLIPLLVLFAVSGVFEVIRLVRRRARGALLASAGVLAAGLVAGNWPLVDPRGGEAVTYGSLGAELAEVGKGDRAVEYYRRALERDPKNYWVHNNLGIQFAERGQDEDAIAHYRQALALRPDYAETHNNLANVLGRMGRVEEARQHLETAIRLNPELPQVWTNLGNLEARAGRYEAAVTAYRKSLGLDPAQPTVERNLRILEARLAARPAPPAAAR